MWNSFAIGSGERFNAGMRARS